MLFLKISIKFSKKILYFIIITNINNKTNKTAVGFVEIA